MKKIKYSRIFILGVFIYILFQGVIILIGLGTSVLTLDNKEYTMRIKTKALVIRDEYLIKSGERGTLSRTVNENEKINKSQRVAIIYNNYIDRNITKEIYNLNEEVKKIEKNTNSLQQSMLSVKKDQLKILEEKLKNNSTNYYSNISGVVSYKYDHSEDKYNSKKLSTLTKDDVESATNNYIPTSENEKSIKQNDVIARVINNDEIYIAFVNEDNKLFNIGDSVKIETKKQLINGEIYRNYKKKGYFITVVKIIQQNIGIYDTRKAEFDIIYKQMEALRIPKTAVVNKNKKMGVYIINEENNKPEFVEIKGVYFKDDEYIYVNFRENETNGVNTVKLHDRIILKPNFINTKIKKIN